MKKYQTYRQTLTCDVEFGVGDVGTTHHSVVALIVGLAVLDLQIMAVTHAADLVLVTVVQFLCALVPGQSDLWVVDSDLALKGGALVLSSRLVCDVFHNSDGLRTKAQFKLFCHFLFLSHEVT